MSPQIANSAAAGTVQARLQQAIQLHQAGQLPQAQAAYRALLADFPKDADATHFLGLLQFQQGESEEGVALVRQSLEVDPSNPHAWNNLGNMYSHLKRREEAREAYLRATTTGQPAAAAWYNLSLIYLHDRQVEQGLSALREATRACRGFVDALQTLAFTYYRLDCPEKAIDVYQQWAEEAPEDPTPRHMLAAASQHDVPERADDRYIVKTFNRFAETFDDKLRRLQYRAPHLVAASLVPHPLYQKGRAVVLDAGCGTGLCGPLLKSTAGKLVGVDLSPNMLQRASERGVYDELHEGELTGFMRAHPGEFDFIVAADVLCYFGRLEEVTEAARQALRPGGSLIFSVEASPDAVASDFEIHMHGRYSHARNYLERTLRGAGFETPQIEPAVLRKEFEQPVHGFIVQGRAGAPS
jgi:predicted TPR repeat methyltransferase